MCDTDMLGILLTAAVIIGGLFGYWIAVIEDNWPR